MKRTFVLILLLAGLSFAALGCKKQDTVKEMADFDKAYIPLLFYTDEGDLESSKRAMVFLDAEWESLKAKYGERAEANPEWKRDFAQIEQMMASAKRILSTTEDLSDAHLALEYIGGTLTEFRRSSGIDYPLDYLNEFHALMGEIIWIERYRTPETLNDDDLNWVRDQLVEAAAVWEKVQQTGFDSDAFGLSAEKGARLRLAIQAESDALQRLDQAIKSGDKAAIIRAASTLQPNFAKAYLLFGDFERVKKE